jgi:ParB-like chromosome segregation protein Spo0J
MINKKIQDQNQMIDQSILSNESAESQPMVGDAHKGEMESVAEVAAEIVDRLNELGLDQNPRSTVKAQAKDVEKGKHQPYHEAHLPKALDSGNHLAQDFAARLRRSREWGCGNGANENVGADQDHVIDESQASSPDVEFHEQDQPPETGGMEWADVDHIQTAEPFEGLLPISDDVLQAIVEDMRVSGYDESRPIVVWIEQDVVVDGHTRLTAARNAGLTIVPVVKRCFESENEAVEYALHSQRGRRNLTDSQLIDLVDKVDKRWPRGGDRRSTAAESKASTAAPIGKSSERTAKMLGISPTKVDKSRRVLASPNHKLIEEVHAGKKSINAAATEIAKDQNTKKIPKAKEKLSKAQRAASAGQKARELLGEACDLLPKEWGSLTDSIKTLVAALEIKIAEAQAQVKTEKEEAKAKKKSAAKEAA